MGQLWSGHLSESLKTHPHVMTAFGKGMLLLVRRSILAIPRDINDLCGLAEEVQFPVAQLREQASKIRIISGNSSRQFLELVMNQLCLSLAFAVEQSDTLVE